jgi:two-component system LytT family response regulator
LQAIIVDDEDAPRTLLLKLLETFCREIEVVHLSDSVQDAYTSIQIHKPEIVFLDIHMGDGNGFSLLSRFTKIDFHVIFVTSFDHYAVQAFKINALDYLLKPVDSNALVNAVRKAVNFGHAKNTEVIKSLLATVEKQQQRIAIPTRDGYLFVSVSEIIRIEADGNYSRIFITGRMPVISSKTLKEYDDALAGLTFIRIHKSHLVNIIYVNEFRKSEGGNIITDDGAVIPISQKKREEFLEKIIRLNGK